MLPKLHLVGSLYNIEIFFFSEAHKPAMALTQRPPVPGRFNSGHRVRGMNLITNLQLTLTLGMRGMQLHSVKHLIGVIFKHKATFP